MLGGGKGLVKLVNYDRQLSVELVCGVPFFIVFESVEEFRKVIGELSISIKEDTEDWILSDEEEIQKKSAVTDLIFSPWMLDLNRKGVQKGVIKRLVQLIQQGVERDLAQNILSDIGRLLDNLAEEMPFIYDYEIDDIAAILKECNIHFAEKSDLMERASQYFRICSELMNTRLFVFIGASNYFTDEEINILAREAGYLGSCMLCIENTSRERKENLILIDKDLCRVI